MWPFRRKSAPRSLAPTEDRGWFTVFESFTGAWQQDVTVNRDQILAYHAVFSCVTLIAADIAKLRIKLVREDNGFWSEIAKGKFKVLDRPNGIQNRIQFVESWIHSKLLRGNAYVLKERDNQGGVRAFHVLNPDRVQVLVSDTGDVFYRLQRDNISGLTEEVTAPASEIIHDRFNCLFHPLVGLSPLFASGLAASHGLSIQKNGAVFFGNMSRPSGILSAPGEITKSTADTLKADWDKNYSEGNQGKVAVLGNDLKFLPMAVPAAEAQLIEQLKMTAEIVCSTYHVPKYKVVGDAPSYNNIEALEQQYYSQCLQKLIEDIELCLDEGLDIPAGTGTEFDLDGLLRMDTATQVKTLSEGVKGAVYTPNEARKRVNQKPIEGGDTVYLQQQMYSLEALAKRDALDDPFASGGKGSDTPPAGDEDDGGAQEGGEGGQDMKRAVARFRKQLELAA